MAPETTPRTAIKVLKGGASWHGGDHAWSLPTQAPDGAWTPGEWTPSVRPRLCEAGWHLTEQPACWWGDAEDGPADADLAALEVPRGA